MGGRPALRKAPKQDLEPLLADSDLLAADGEAEIRLTAGGQRLADELHDLTRPFQPSPRLRRARPLYSWQDEALSAWATHGRFGVIEAVTGTGKTRVGVEAAAEAVDQGLNVVICVPTLVLMEQWVRVLNEYGLHSVGRFGGGHHDVFDRHRIVVGTIQSLRRAPQLLVHDNRALMIVDECHRSGAPTFQAALDPRYVRRLGLTATFERSDSRIDDLQAFFEGSPVFQIGYDRAVPEGIVAEYVVARVGVDFTPDERQEYREADAICGDCRRRLIGAGLPDQPFGDFMAAVAKLAADDRGALGTCARRYLEAFSRRAKVLSLAQGKVEAVRALAPVVAGAHGCLLFTLRVTGAERAAQILADEGVRVTAIHGQSSAEDREEALSLLRTGELRAVAAPRILDEGVDVPDADLAVIIATSSSRLQMIQRMGRVLRLKQDGRRARFVLLFVRGTAEDPITSDAHEAFFDAIVPTASAIEDFDLRDSAQLCHFLTGPLTCTVD